MKPNNTCRIGVDVGSTTLKIIIIDSQNEIIYKKYRRHKADFNTIFIEELGAICQNFPHTQFSIRITGSAGIGIAERTGLPFVQEVVASIEVIQRHYPSVRTMIDLGGEDAKLVFFGDGRKPDIRMNGSCAGGTGAFIDQMADLMNIPIAELGKQALKYGKIYPVASRCGVFAKTDVQNMIARNVPTPDVAMSILHTVAVQAITSLSRGSDIDPQVIFIGGPLTFIAALRDAFKNLLQLKDSDIILPENSEYFPALGAALCDKEDSSVKDLHAIIESLSIAERHDGDTLAPLFSGNAQYAHWLETRKIVPLKRRKLSEYGQQELECFLGIDSGSTTTKILITDSMANVLYSFYSANEGNPLRKVVEGLSEFYRLAKEAGLAFRFVSSAATGYGEDLIKSALNLDYGIVETMAHLCGAQYVDPDVTFVLDIGGQDMKSIFTQKGVISNIELNEACSSGCGSFLQNFAATMNVTLEEFTRIACLAQYPQDLGTRCTVFMNSKVKQSLRENASLGDISAGLVYSVVKNCLFKVLKISNLNKLGDHIVVQGGTFRNDAVYRALELLSGKSVSSTDCPELMGAFGAALYARKMWLKDQKQTEFTGAEALPDVDRIDTTELQCKGCTNKCSVLRFRFDNGNTSFAGNKCEKVFYSQAAAREKGYNAFDAKNEMLFARSENLRDKAVDPEQPQRIGIPRVLNMFENLRDKAVDPEQPQRIGIPQVLNMVENLRDKAVNPEQPQRIGIPRVLNMFENYPFWHTLLTECGFEVVLSAESTFELYQKGVASVMSDNVCFPAKLVHGHVHSLIEQGVDRIFYPIVPKEYKEFGNASNSFNCPVVSGYPDVVRSSMDPARKYGIPFDMPVISFHDDRVLSRASFRYLETLGISKDAFDRAFKTAMREREEFQNNLRSSQKEILDDAVRDDKMVFIVAGRPYHTDPLIHQKTGQILSDMGITVLTDDVFRSARNQGFADLKLVSQWSYPNRTVQAAMEVAQLPHNVQFVHLNSFGCGPDSFFMDEVGDVLRNAGKNHTILRIDEIASPGSVRLRLRSLIESLKVIVHDQNPETVQYVGYETVYTKKDKTKTILIPWFTDFLSPFIPALGELAGYKIVNLPKSSKTTADAGLKYGHNEVCYPSTLILGDIVTALQSGNHDLNDTVVAITQTGGQCRATNYLAQIKSGLENAGFAHIPVVAITAGGVYQNEQKAFKIPMLKIANITIYAILYADAIQQMYSSTIAKESIEGSAKSLFDRYIDKGVEAVRRNDSKELLRLLEQAVADYNSLEINSRTVTRVGLIGEIYVKYNNYGQANITNWMRSKGIEVVTPPFLDFVMQYFVNSQVNEHNGLDRNVWINRFLSPVLWKYINAKIAKVEHVMCSYRFHESSRSIYTKSQYASQILDLSNQFGEGWTLAAEVACFARDGINRVVCVQPFGCIANHIVAKGIEKRIKTIYPLMNMLYLDIDGGMAEVNLQNRLHFLIN